MRTKADSGHKKPVNMARIIKTPIRAMSRALDLYVKGLNNFSNTYNRPLTIRTTLHEAVTAPDQRLPRSFSTSRLPAGTDQPPEGALVRSISTSTAATGGLIKATNVEISSFELQMVQRHCSQMQSRKSALRSRSVGMGKIEEDRVSSFRNYDNSIVLKSMLGIKDEDLVVSKSRLGDDHRLHTKRSI